MLQLEALSVALEAHVATIHFNRPDKANALNEQMWDELRRAFEWADDTPEVRVVVLAGEGRHFCAGIDLMMLAGLQQAIHDPCEGRKREKLLATIRRLQRSVTALEACRKPVIAAIHGACVGGGLDVALAADIRLAAGNATFCVKEIDIGMVADVGTLQRLHHVVGDGRARELALTGRQIDAEEAERIGLVTQVLPDKEILLSAASELAGMLAGKSPLALRGTKQVLNYSRDHSVAEGLEQVAHWNAAMLISSDIQAAVMAQMQGQTPVFAD